MIHTNRCKNCGKTKPEHSRIEMNGYPDTWACVLVREVFEDSGLAALDAHKEELYEATKEVLAALKKAGNPSSFDYPSSMIPTIIRKCESILNQIEKEK